MIAYITANNGGTLSLETARARPLDTVLSGPASGVVASLQAGAAAGLAKLITFDMGGTSADISVCQTGAPEFTTQTFVGDFPLMLPVVNVGAIGAGGGSVVSVDAQGVLKVGPLSAGADPGPVCYGRGGTEPTLTDCYLVLGILDPAGFLGGRMALDAAAAHAALETVAARLGLPGAVAAAVAAVRVASARMATEITKLLATAGADPREFVLVAYGGAGPTHGSLLADEAQLTAVMVPAAPGNFCALGALLADIRRDYVRTLRTRLGAVPDPAPAWAAITATLRALEDEARAWIAREGSIIGPSDVAVSFDMRYAAQAYELRIAVPPELRPALDGPGLAALFHAEHERLYGFREPATPVETATVRLAVIGRVPPVRLTDAPAAQPAPRGRRTVWHRGRPLSAAVYARAETGAGATVTGPAVIEQPDTTTFVLPGWRATADRIGTLHLSREQAP